MADYSQQRLTIVSPNKDYQKKRVRKDKIRNYLNSLKKNGCSLCGYKRTPAAIEFHHLDPKNKHFELSISKSQDKSINRIIVETTKCLIVCANCHRELHEHLIPNSRIKKALLTQQGGRVGQLLLFGL